METKFKAVIENLRHINFENEKVFTGIFQSKVTLGKDSAKPFDVYKFADILTGEMVYLPSNYSIEKGIQSLIDAKTNFEQTVIQIEYLGKTEVNGKHFSRFNFGECSLQQYEGKPEENQRRERK